MSIFLFHSSSLLISNPIQLNFPAKLDHKTITLLEASALSSGCEAFGLRMVELRQLSDFV